MCQPMRVSAQRSMYKGSCLLAGQSKAFFTYRNLLGYTIRFWCESTKPVVKLREYERQKLTEWQIHGQTRQLLKPPDYSLCGLKNIFYFLHDLKPLKKSLFDLFWREKKTTKMTNNDKGIAVINNHLLIY